MWIPNFHLGSQTFANLWVNDGWIFSANVVFCWQVQDVPKVPRAFLSQKTICKIFKNSLIFGSDCGAPKVFKHVLKNPKSLRRLVQRIIIKSSNVFSIFCSRKAECVTWYNETKSFAHFKHSYRRKYQRALYSSNFNLKWIRDSQNYDTLRFQNWFGWPSMPLENEKRVSSYLNKHWKILLKIEERRLSLPKSCIQQNLRKQTLNVSVQTSHFTRA